VLLGDVSDQLLDEDRLAQSGAAEQADLAALDEGGDQVHDLEAGLEDLDRRNELTELRRVAVDRPALPVRRSAVHLVDRLADHVPEAAERRIPDRHRDRRARVEDVDAAGDAVRRVHRHRTHAVVSEVLLHLRDEHASRFAVARWDLDMEGVVDLGKLVGKHGVEHNALDLEHLADVPGRLFRHLTEGYPIAEGPI
jgi:hypothetical protein